MNSVCRRWLARLCGVAILATMTAPAAVLLDDTWADGTRTNTSLPTDAAWYASSAASLVAAANSLTATPNATQSRTWWTFFTTNAASLVALNVGDTLKPTLTFTPSGVVAQNAVKVSVAFRDRKSTS